METLVHDKTKIRGTFAENCSKAFVLGNAFENYCSWIMWMKDTRSTKILATVFQKHKYITNPDITPKDWVISATGKLADSLKGRMPPHLRETTINKLDRIGTILKHERPQRFIPTRPGYLPIRLHPPTKPTLLTSKSELLPQLHHWQPP